MNLPSTPTRPQRVPLLKRLSSGFMAGAFLLTSCNSGGGFGNNAAFAEDGTLKPNSEIQFRDDDLNVKYGEYDEVSFGFPTSDDTNGAINWEPIQWNIV